MSFCTENWQAVHSIREAIHAHPFVVELGEGTLSQERFIHYLQQDSHYLGMYAQVLSLIAARAPDAAARHEFAGGARVAIEVEQSLHARLTGGAGTGSPSPACLGYGSYLVSLAATRSYAVAVAGILPCFVIYADVGLALAATTKSGNPHAEWIATYADPAFLAATRRVEAIADVAAQSISPAERAGMAEAYRIACRYEWMFWDAAYHQSTWPIDAPA